MIETILDTVPLLSRGTDHHDRLEDADLRVVVSGIRGKSSTTRRLHDVLVDRGHDTYAKVTGDHPLSIRNGDVREIERGDRVTLYENVDEVADHADGADALVMENQAITDYTTRVFNECFADPDVVFLANVRQDHRDTLGSDRRKIARAFARSVTPGTHVVNGEQDPDLRAYLDAELARRDVSVTHVDVPEAEAHIPGAECVHGLDAVLDALGLDPLSDERRQSYLNEMRPDWTHVEGGRVFNAASVNDVESTEVIRQYLAEDDAPVVQPLVYLREDRRARTASFVEYLDRLHDEGAVEQVRAVGHDADLFAEKTDVPVVEHCPDADSEAVLDDALDDDHPVLFVGNTVADFMRGLEDAVEARAVEPETVSPTPSTTESETVAPRVRADGGTVTDDEGETTGEDASEETTEGTTESENRDEGDDSGGSDDDDHETRTGDPVEWPTLRM